MRRLAPLLLLAACGPMSPQAAADYCEQRARLAMGPRGEVGIGITQNGPAVVGDIALSTDYLTRRDPQVVYEQCVHARSGQGPIRPPRLD